MRGSSNDDEISRIKVLCIGRCPIFIENGGDVLVPSVSALSLWDTTSLLLFTLSLNTIMALLVDGVVRGLISRELHDEVAIYVLIFAIGISEWPQFARVARGVTLVEKNKDYISAARIIGLPNGLIMFKHILPNILRPILVIGTIGLALAILAESTLSFLGVGVPPTTPSLGTLIRLGNDFLFSGEWWISFFPSFFLVILAFSINLLGDWMRDTLNPKIN